MLDKYTTEGHRNSEHIGNDKLKKMHSNVYDKNQFARQLPGQACVLQSIASRDGPGQFFPLLLGGGLSQLRVLYFSPPPHVFEHRPKTLHGDQFPSTKYENIIACNYMFS